MNAKIVQGGDYGWNVAALLLVVLKLAGLIGWPWFVVLAPFWLPFASVGVVWVVSAAAVALGLPARR